MARKSDAEANGKLAMHKLLERHVFIKKYNDVTFDRELHCTVCGYKKVDKSSPNGFRSISDRMRLGELDTEDALKMIFDQEDQKDDE